MKNELMLHCGGKPATFEDIASVEIPEATESYRPIPNGDLVRLVRREVEVRTQLNQPEMFFGMNKNNNQMFGCLRYNPMKEAEEKGTDISAFLKNGVTDDSFNKYGFVIGLRNSYDKSLSVGFCGGTSCFVCDNLAFHGSQFTFMSHHTRNVWDRLVPTVMTKIAPMVEDFHRMVLFQDSMIQSQVSMDDGYKLIGLARGHGVLTTVQSSKALDEWRDMNGDTSHQFAQYHNTGFGLYQNFTEALKFGHIGRKIDEYTGVSAFFEDIELANPMIFSEPIDVDYEMNEESAVMGQVA